MIRLTADELTQLISGGTLTIYRRKGSDTVTPLYRHSRGKTIDVIVCTGRGQCDRYRARAVIINAKRLRGGRCQYVFQITISELGEKL